LTVLEKRLRWVGQSVPRVDGLAKVTGSALYPGDLTRPGMLYMKIRFAGRPHARIVDLDIGRALAEPGVVTVLTAQDVAHNAYGLALSDQPVLCNEVVRFEGDQVAAVVAETEEVAARACDLIDVIYEDLPVVSDPRAAMSADSQLVHADHPRNILKEIHILRGEPAEGFARADVIVESDYFSPMQEHAYLQPEAGLAYMDGDVVVVETAGQWAHHDQRQIARALGLPLNRVRVIYQTIGGAFGGREDISIQIVLALAALRTGRPVKIIWSRAESIRGHAKRHQTYIRTRWGATRDGKVLAAEAQVIADAGAYAYTSTMVLGHIAMTCMGVYDIPNVKVDSYAVYTNNVPAGAFRGFGSPQGIFAAEMQMDKLAAALKLDPITIRERNLLHEGDLLPVGAPLPPGIRLDRLLERCAKEAGWSRTANGWSRSDVELDRISGRRRGVGIAIGFKNVGFSFGYPEESTVALELHGGAEIERVVVRFSGAECGQGVYTIIRQMAAEVLSLPLEKIEIIGADTLLSPEAGSASASRLTLMGGNALIAAAREALRKWQDEDRPASATYTYRAVPTTDLDPKTGQGNPHVALSPIAQAVEVEVDLGTGEIAVPRVITVIDPGRVMNPQLLEGQVEGAVAQAIGFALLEHFVTQDGIILTPDLSTYLVPTILDVPAEVRTIALEHAELEGPWGARGIGETAALAIAPALVAAVGEATGVRFDSLPLTPSAVWQGLLAVQGRQATGTRTYP
jgi:CO/xanthine dehydrogenase Mo-binding subunit